MPIYSNVDYRYEHLREHSTFRRMLYEIFKDRIIQNKPEVNGESCLIYRVFTVLID